MRRLALSLLAASSLALLTACGQGGTAFGSGQTGTASSVILSSGQGLTGVFIVRAGTSIQVSAEAVQGSQGALTTNQQFTFAATFAPSGTLYQNGSPSGAQQSACPAPPAAVNATIFAAANVLTNAGSNFVTVNPPANAAPWGAPYCLNLVATHTVDGVQGNAVIFVTT
jgi:hypothetical protein